MKIAIITASLELGGAERSLVKLVQAISPMIQQVHLLCLSHADKAVTRELPAEANLVMLGAHSSSNPIHLLRVYLKLRQLDPDVVIGWSTYANLVTVLATRWLPGCKVVLSERNYLPRMFSRKNVSKTRRRMVLELIRRFYPKADIITANSTISVRCLRKYIGKGPRYHFIPNVINSMEVHKKSECAIPMPLIPVKGPKILAVGRLDYQKGFDILLEALRLVRTLYPWSLVVAGDGRERSMLLRKAQRLELSAHVQWVGRQDNPFPFYRWADIVVVPSRYEGFPNVALESMAMGKAVICSDCHTGPRELTEGGRYGMLVPTGDVQALAHAIVALGLDPDKRNHLGENARQHVLKNYDSSNVQKKYLLALGIE